MSGDPELLARIELLEARQAKTDHEVAALRAERAALPPEPHDPFAARRRVIRAAVKKYFTYVAATYAARAFALRWKDWEQRKTSEEPRTDSIEAVFAELARGGLTSLSERTIREDLDESLDRHRR